MEILVCSLCCRLASEGDEDGRGVWVVSSLLGFSVLIDLS